MAVFRSKALMRYFLLLLVGMLLAAIYYCGDTMVTDKFWTSLKIRRSTNTDGQMVPLIKRYFVNSSKCRIPYVEHLSPELRKIYKPAPLMVCSKESDLFQLSYDQDTQHYQLQVKQDILYKLNPLVDHFACSYRGISSDQKTKLHPSVKFEEQQELPKNIIGVIAECHDEKNESRIVQQDAFPLVQVMKTSIKSEAHPLDRQPSVIILGLDSMSRMNFRRTMPKTAEYVRKEGWFELEGYNKVEDNTIPNLFAVLSGEVLPEVNQYNRGALKSMPWIWREYKRAGYVTAITEDIIKLPVFADVLQKVPADHVLRPLLVYVNRILKSYMSFGYHYCIGRRLSVSYVLDFCSQFSSRYVEELDQPAFGFFWSCTFTHDFYFVAASLDGIFSTNLRLLERQQLFDRSIVILMSDHGARFGDLMELSDSFLEERLPMMHIYLPPWFRSTYPRYAEALSLNRNRLCSNFDLHNTLQHILRLNASTPAELPPLITCPSSQSLLHPLPEDRGCEDACIGEHWCTCNEFMRLPLDVSMRRVGKSIVSSINRWMLEHKFNTYCQRLLFLGIDQAEQKVAPERNLTDRFTVTLRLRFRTSPKLGKFRTTLRYNLWLNKIEYLHIPDISRINSYRTDAPCMWDTTARKFCFCYPKQLNAIMRAWQNT